MESIFLGQHGIKGCEVHKIYWSDYGLGLRDRKSTDYVRKTAKSGGNPTLSQLTVSYRISNIEEIRGGPGDDILRGDAGSNTLRGYAGDDRLEGGAGDDRLYGGDGDDVFVFERGHGTDHIDDVTDGDDVIVLRGFGLSKSDVLSGGVAGPWSDGTGVWIDLTGHGGGRIEIGGLDFDNLDGSDFLL